MARPQPKDAQYYRDRAEEARTLAEAMSNAPIKAIMLEIAKDWDRIAERVERLDSGDTAAS